MKRCDDSLLSLDLLAAAVKGREISGKSPDLFCFKNVQADSRTVCEDSLFVPLVGEVQDGHRYVPEAAEKGASVVFVCDSEYSRNAPMYDGLCRKHVNLFIITVHDTLRALQDAAACYVERFPGLVKVCVTGSSGKTTTKEMIVSVLKEKFNVVSTRGNFNSETGLPLSVFNIRAFHEVGVFEMGMNRVGEISEISGVLKARYAVLTNIGSAHIGILGSRKNIAAEKKHAFDHVGKEGCAFIPESDDFRDFLSEGVQGEIIYYGKSVPSSKSGVVFVEDRGVSGTVFRVDGLEVNLKVPGIYNYSNALSAVALGKKLGLTAEEIKNGLEKLHSVDGRMETSNLVLKNGCSITLVKDCYNANPDSMNSAIGFMKGLEASGRKIFVLGDMLELGDESFSLHSEVGKSVSGADFVYFVGKEMASAYRTCVSMNVADCVYFPDFDGGSVKKIATSLCERLSDGDVLLLKASRGISLERIVPLVAKEGA